MAPGSSRNRALRTGGPYPTRQLPPWKQHGAAGAHSHVHAIACRHKLTPRPNTTRFACRAFDATQSSTHEKQPEGVYGTRIELSDVLRRPAYAIMCSRDKMYLCKKKGRLGDPLYRGYHPSGDTEVRPVCRTLNELYEHATSMHSQCALSMFSLSARSIPLTDTGRESSMHYPVS